MREEVFGPVLALERVASTAEAFTRVNASRFGLQAGVFTHDIGTAFLAHRELEVGGVVVGESRPLTSPAPPGRHTSWPLLRPRRMTSRGEAAGWPMEGCSHELVP